MFWQRADIIEKLNLSIDPQSVQRVRQQRMAILQKDAWQTKFDSIAAMPDWEDLAITTGDWQVDLDQPAVTIGQRSDLNDQQFEQLVKTVEILMPWRKGPFQVFGLDIDAEWRSDQKWDRIVDAVGDLNGKRILDVGCGNGYYMLRAAAAEPRFVLGLDPSPNFLLQFEFLQKYLCRPELQMELLGFEHLSFFHKTFDTAFCMGILYHHPSPVETLRQLRRTLRIGGMALVESQAIVGDESFAIFPRDRYAKARNVFFVPTANCLANWVRRAGFTDVEVVSVTKVTSQEQRKTRHMVFESLDDFLDPNDPDLTVEGYPAPYRAVVIGRRTTE